MTQTQTETLVLRPDVIATVIEDGAVLLDLASKYFYTVNHAGWAILQLFEAGTTRTLVETQCAKWGADAGDARAITSVLDMVIADRLVAPTTSPAADLDIPLEQRWSAPTIERSREPLQRIMKSPFDPTLPLAE